MSQRRDLSFQLPCNVDWHHPRHRRRGSGVSSLCSLYFVKALVADSPGRIANIASSYHHGPSGAVQGSSTTGAGPVAGSTVRAPRGWGSAGLGDLAAKNASRSHHVDDRHGQPKERPDEHDDVPRPPFGKHQRSVQPTRMGTATRVEPPAWAVPTLAWRVSSAR